MDQGLTLFIDQLVQVAEVKGRLSFLVLVIDESGSMAKRSRQVLEMVDVITRELSDIPGADTAYLCIVAFSVNVRVCLPPTLLANVRRFSNYRPDTSTALYAASDDVLSMCLNLKEMIDRLPGIHPDFNVEVTVLSDGGDNASLERQESAQRRAAEARAQGFRLVPIGIGTSHTKLAEQLGFDEGLGVTVEATAEGMRQATEHTTTSFGRTVTGSVVTDQDQIPTGSFVKK